ncbi:hypothetical protein TNCV_4716471 [Trichonephila clavipes]|nr:hypothetical protein TNCV_4716471 [Trichonephila clavipes]
MRQITRDIRISDRSVRRIAKTNLGLKPYKGRNVQLLTEKNKLIRLRRCQKPLRRAANQCKERFLFIDDIGLLPFNKFITPKTIESGLSTL